MSDQFLGEIRMCPFNFAPYNWAFCDGQLMSISQNTALFSLLFDFYGGDGRVTFALPNMKGAAPMQQGQGQGLSLRDLGEVNGTPTVSVLTAEIPAHTHTMSASSVPSTLKAPASNDALARASGGNAYLAPDANVKSMNAQMIGSSGASAGHNNMQPYLTLYFIIALAGIFPPRP